MFDIDLVADNMLARLCTEDVRRAGNKGMSLHVHMYYNSSLFHFFLVIKASTRGLALPVVTYVLWICTILGFSVAKTYYR